MRKVLTALVLFVTIFSGLHAQQLPLLDNYLINPVSISPAFTGKLYKFQALLTHRMEWTNLPGSPIIGNVNIDADLGKNMGLGGSFLISKAGIYRNFTANLNYAYHLRVAAEHILSFGINLAVYQNSLNLTDLVIRDEDDPMIVGKDNITETYFNVGTSLLYNWKDLNFCVAFPLLLNNRSLYSSNEYEHVLSMSRNWLIYAGYALHLGADWKLKFDLLFRQTQYSPLTVDLSAMVMFMDSYWLGAFYRKSNIIGLTAGLAIVNRIVINYNFEFSGFAMMGSGGGTHEISLGYRLPKTKPTQVLKIKDYVK